MVSIKEIEMNILNNKINTLCWLNSVRLKFDDFACCFDSVNHY